MTSWTPAELEQIGNAEELEIASLRSDGTLRRPTTIWVVRVGDDLYVRSVNGRGSGWFRGTQVQHAGQIEAGGLTKAVTFEDVTDPALTAPLDAAYRAKYRRYAANIVNSTLTPAAHSATLKLVPRD
jgi:hypothetical protein